LCLWNWCHAPGDDVNGNQSSSAYVFYEHSDHEFNIYCNGNLIWSDITLIETVTENINVEKNGESGSLLDWEIESYPDWGTWIFVPENGTDQKQGDTVSIEVEVVAPDEEDTEFRGDIKIVNCMNSSEYCIVDVSLATAINQRQRNQQIFSFLMKNNENSPLYQLILGFNNHSTIAI